VLRLRLVSLEWRIVGGLLSLLPLLAAGRGTCSTACGARRGGPSRPAPAEIDAGRHPSPEHGPGAISLSPQLSGLIEQTLPGVDASPLRHHPVGVRHLA
jgi:hypothetical protein